MSRFISSKIEITADEQETRPFAAQIARMAHSSFAEPVCTILPFLSQLFLKQSKTFSKLFSDTYVFYWTARSV